MRAPSPWNPSPRYSVLVVAADDGALNQARPAATRSAPSSDSFRVIAKLPPWSTCGPGHSRPEFAGTIRDEGSSEARSRQLEREAKTSMEGQPVEGSLLANDLSDRRIEEFGLRRARVPDGFSVETGIVRDLEVGPAEELGAEAVVIVLEIESAGIRPADREELPADAAAHVGLQGGRRRNAHAQRAHHRDEIRVDVLRGDHRANVRAVG